MRIAVAMIVAGMMVVGGSAWAGEAEKAKEVSVYVAAAAGLTLTDEQKAKIAEIEATWRAEGGTEEADRKARDQIRALLTDEQRVEYDTKLDKKAKRAAGC